MGIGNQAKIMAENDFFSGFRHFKQGEEKFKKKKSKKCIVTVKCIVNLIL